MICVSVANIAGLKEAVESGAALLELRLDLIGEHPSKLFPLISGDMKNIVTCRPGGYSQSERLELLRTGMKLGADYVDIEIETPVSDLELLLGTARETGTEVIISYHNFERTADREDLESIMIACYEKGGDLPGKKVILGMGTRGRITRVMGPYLGAEFTFASTLGSGETAPGQLSFKQLNDIYKVIDES
jgi:3-dehydroquinate dehydratase